MTAYMVTLRTYIHTLFRSIKSRFEKMYNNTIMNDMRASSRPIGRPLSEDGVVKTINE